MTRSESAETMRIARKRMDALNIPRLDGMSVMRVDKINDTAAVTMTVARAGPPGRDGLSRLIETAPVTKRQPALVFGGGATCDNAVGRQIERTTKEVWSPSPALIGAQKRVGPQTIVCTVWHLQGGGFVAPASREGSPAFLTHWPEDRQSSEFVIHVPTWAELTLPWYVYGIFALIACAVLSFVVGICWLLSTFPDQLALSSLRRHAHLAIPEVDLRPTVEEAREQDRLEREVPAGVVRMSGLSFAEVRSVRLSASAFSWARPLTFTWGRGSFMKSSSRHRPPPPPPRPPPPNY